MMLQALVCGQGGASASGLFSRTTQGGSQRSNISPRTWRRVVVTQSLAATKETTRDEVQECTQIESLAVPSGGDQTGVTALLSEACSSMEALGKHYIPSGLLREQASLQDLKEYFARPVFVGGGTLTTATRSRIIRWPFNNSGSSGILALFPSSSARLQGVYGVRYKAVFTLFVSSTPFHQGVVVLSWQYGMNDTAGAITDYSRSLYSSTCTNLPHVRMDLSQQTMVQLSVPFLAEEEFQRLVVSGSTTQHDPMPYGTLAINTILPVAAVTGIVAPEYRVMVHLEDMEFIGAAPKAVGTVTCQGGKPVNVEFETDAYPYSSALHAASRAVGWVAKGVPSLSSIAGPASWFLGKAAGVARYFGFSKPQIQEPPMRVVQVKTAGEFNVDMPSATMMVAPMASNSLRVDSSIACSDVDELSLSYVLSQWSQICVGSMSTTNPNGTVLYAAPITPSAFWFRAPSSLPYTQLPAPYYNTGKVANAFIVSHAFYWSSMFRYWRGGFTFRFTFGKTKMHGGRVLVAYNPADFHCDPGQTTFSMNVAENQPFAQSAIFDLRDSNVFEFKVPYSSALPFRGFFEATGSLVMYVMDALQAPSVVSSSVPFLVEVKCDADYEVAVPRGVMYPASVKGTPRTQGGNFVANTINASASELAIGESLASAKQLLMMPKMTRFMYDQVTDSYTSSGGTSTITLATLLQNTTTSFVINPWWFHPAIALPLDLSTFTALDLFPPEAFTMAGNIAKCYAFARGSTDAHVYARAYQTTGLAGAQSFGSAGQEIHPSSSAVPLLISASYCANDYGSGDINLITANGANMPSAITYEDTPLHVRFPSYLQGARTRTHWCDTDYWYATYPRSGSVPNAPAWNGYDASATGSRALPRISIMTPRLLNHTATQVMAAVGRCAGDDAQLGFYMGPPPLALPDDSLKVPGAGTQLCPWSTDSLMPHLGGIYDGGAKYDSYVDGVSTFPYYFQGFFSPSSIIAPAAAVVDPGLGGPAPAEEAVSAA
nr:MAG: structural polyprotein [Hangzhou dicistro-like virus 6]